MIRREFVTIVNSRAGEPASALASASEPSEPSMKIVSPNPMRSASRAIQSSYAAEGRGQLLPLTVR